MIKIKNDENGLILIDTENDQALFIKDDLRQNVRFFLASAASNVGITEEFDYIKMESTPTGVYVSDDKEIVHLEPNDMYRVLNTLGVVTQEDSIAYAIATMEVVGEGALVENFFRDAEKAIAEYTCSE